MIMKSIDFTPFVSDPWKHSMFPDAVPMCGGYEGEPMPEMYIFDTFRRKTGIAQRVLDSVPRGTMIVNAGAGYKDEFTAEQLEAGDHRMVTVDYDQAALEPSDNVYAKIGIDADLIPDSLANKADNIRRALELMKSKCAVADHQEQYRMLIELLGERPVGGHFISQFFIYLKPETVDKYLKICAENLVEGGRIDIFDRSIFLVSMMNEYKSGKRRGFESARKLVESIDDLIIEADRFIVPVVENGELAEMEEEFLHQAFGPHLLATEMYERIGGGAVDVAEIDISQDAHVKNYDYDDGRTAVPCFGQRWLSIVKKCK